MVNYTPNLNLAKPTLSDVADITVISANFDILDSALAKMVTTDSPQEITGSKTFSGTVIVNGHNLRNAVTTDETQTITGQKTFSNNVFFSDRVIQFNTGRTGNCIWVNDRNVQSSTDKPSSASYTYPMVYKANNGDVLGFLVMGRNANGEGYNQLTTYDANGSNSSVIVNKTGNMTSTTLTTMGYVESTDGTTNNLVHRSANEKVDGIKEFAYNTDKHVGTHLESTSGYWVKLVKWTGTALRYNIVMTVLANYYRDVNFYGKLMFGTWDSTNFDHLDLISPYNWADRFKLTNNGTETVLWYHNTTGQYKFGLNVFIDIECNDTDKSSRAILIPASEQVAENPNWSSFAHVLNGTYKGWGA